MQALPDANLCHSLRCDEGRGAVFWNVWPLRFAWLSLMQDTQYGGQDVM